MDKLTVNEMIDAIKKNYPPPQYSMLKEALDHASELMKAEAEGRLVVLPCKEGDTVWTIWDDEVRENTVLGVTVDRYGLHILAQYNQGGAIRDYNFDRIGKTVFLTREAAEAALKEREGK